MLKDSKDHENLLKEYEMIKEENQFLNCEISMAEEQIRELEKVLQMVMSLDLSRLACFVKKNLLKLIEFIQYISIDKNCILAHIFSSTEKYSLTKVKYCFWTSFKCTAFP